MGKGEGGKLQKESFETGSYDLPDFFPWSVFGLNMRLMIGGGYAHVSGYAAA